jgi:5-methylcytosine-specific restriction endonuclease McrA
MHVDPHDIHGYGIRCTKCGIFVQWLGKGTKRKSSVKYAWDGKEKICGGCGITEKEARVFGILFEIDHIIPLEFGGKDEPENTLPLCSVCHQTKTARQRWARGIKRLFQAKEEGAK